MADIFREVDEDLRKAQLKRLWDRYGVYVIGLAVLIVVATAGYRGWQYWQSRQAEASGDRFVAALMLADDGKHDEAIAALNEIAADGSGGYPALAAFRAAAETAASGDHEAAAAQFEAIARRNDLPPQVGDLARLRAAMLLSDSMSASELSSQIGDLADTGNPWRQEAREILGFAAFRENDLAAAQKYFSEIVDDQESGQGARSRAQVMLALIASRQGAPAAPAPEG